MINNINAGATKFLAYLGKYEGHPPLPYGLSVSYIKPAKYKIETSLEFFRDNVTVEKMPALL